MSERKKVKHPSWCDREKCTAPEYHPTHEEWQPSNGGGHRSKVLPLGMYDDVGIMLTQSVAPWECATYLRIREAGGSTEYSTQVDEHGAGFALFELLGQEIRDAVEKFPSLYAERFAWAEKPQDAEPPAQDAVPAGHVTDAQADWTCGTGASLMADAMTPGPGKLGTLHAVIYVCPDHRGMAEERITAAGYIPEVQDAPPAHRWDPWECGHITAYGAKGVRAVPKLASRPPAQDAGEDEWGSLPGVTDTYPSTAISDNVEHVEEEPPADSQSQTYRLEVDDALITFGTLRVVQAAVAELVTDCLAEDVNLATEAQMMHMAFSTGAIERGSRETGEWSTTFGAGTRHAHRIKVTREA